MGGVVGSAVGDGLSNAWGGTALGDFAARSVSGLAAGTAAAVMRGGRVSTQQVAVDAFGNAIGNSLAAANSSGSIYVSQEEKLRDQFQKRRAFGMLCIALGLMARMYS